MLRFNLYRFVSRLYFYLPILVWYFMRRGLNPLETALEVMLYPLSTAMVQSYSVRLSRTAGLKSTLLLGELAKAAGLVCLSFGTALASTLLLITSACGQILAGIGYGMTAGNDSALLHEISATKGLSIREQESKSSSYLFLAVLFSGIVGAVAARFSYAWPFLLSAATALTAAVLIGMLPDVSPTGSEPALGASKPTAHPTASLQSTQWMQIYYAVIRAFVLGMFVYVTPYFLVRFSNGRSVILLSLVLSEFTLVAFVSGSIFKRLQIALHNYIWPFLPIVAVLSLVLYLVLGNTILYLQPALLGLVAGTIRPLFSSRIADMFLDSEAIKSCLSYSEKYFGYLNLFFVFTSAVVIQFAPSPYEYAFGCVFILVGMGTSWVLYNA